MFRIFATVCTEKNILSRLVEVISPYRSGIVESSWHTLNATNAHLKQEKFKSWVTILDRLERITINVPLFKKLRDIIYFFAGQ